MIQETNSCRNIYGLLNSRTGRAIEVKGNLYLRLIRISRYRGLSCRHDFMKGRVV